MSALCVAVEMGFDKYDHPRSVEKKLNAGLRVRDYVPSFGERNNEPQTVAHCEWNRVYMYFYRTYRIHTDFAQHFKEIAKQHTSAVRPFRVYTTSVVVSTLIFCRRLENLIIGGVVILGHESYCLYPWNR